MAERIPFIVILFAVFFVQRYCVASDSLCAALFVYLCVITDYASRGILRCQKHRSCHCGRFRYAFLKTKPKPGIFGVDFRHVSTGHT